MFNGFWKVINQLIEVLLFIVRVVFVVVVFIYFFFLLCQTFYPNLEI